MKKKTFSMFPIIGLAVATTISLALLTACDDDDDDTIEADTSEDTTDIDDSSTVTGSINGYDYVDLGLSVKWAYVNLGATLPADYGDYYAWGEIATKDSFDIDSSETYYDTSIEDFSGDATYDAATTNIGDTWRIPTQDECQALRDSCIWTWMTRANTDGDYVYGYKVEGSNGNSIFLPAAGYYYVSTLNDAGKTGCYWSSTPDASGSDAYLLGFNKSDNPYVNDFTRYYGRSVRAVSE